MLRRHSEQLFQRLDELYANGTTYISWGELYHWYNIKRLAKTPWRDIKGGWEQLLEEKGEQYLDPNIAQLESGVAFFFSREPKTLSDLAE